MLKYEEQYLNLGKRILEEGVWVENERTGRKCLTIPEAEIKIYGEEIPLLTTKQSYPVSALAEVLGYLRGYEWADQFDKIGAKTWYVNANETEAWLNNPNRLMENHIGKVYGAAIGSYEIDSLMNKLNTKEDDRALVLEFWRPELFDKGCLKPCMHRHQWIILGDTLYLKSSSRSVDYACGLNFNSLQCWFLLKMVAEAVGLKAGYAAHTMTHVHIYDSHIDNVKMQLKREPLNTAPNVVIHISTLMNLFEERHAREYFSVTGYEHLGKIEFDLVA